LEAGEETEVNTKNMGRQTYLAVVALLVPRLSVYMHTALLAKSHAVSSKSWAALSWG